MSYSVSSSIKRYAIIGTTAERIRLAGGADIKETRATGIIFASLTEAQAAQLRASGYQVSPVGQVRAVIGPPVPVGAVPRYSPYELVWSSGINEIRKMTSPPLYGLGLNLALIDSGIRETHSQLGGRVVCSKNYTTSPMRDGFDHGTAVCSVALAVAPSCNILNLKVVDDAGIGDEEAVVTAIDDCIAMNDEGSEYAPWVINLSLGAADDGNPNNPVRVACRAAIDKGIWVIAAAGNSGPASGSILSPACEKYVFAIGSAKYEPFVVSDFSSRGPTKEGLIKPDVLEFGEDMALASSESDAATVAKSGTSFSAPFFSGLAVLYNEGLKRRAILTQSLVNLPARELYYVSPKGIMDNFLPYLTIKPAGEAADKDNSYGYGFPGGPPFFQALQAVAAPAGISNFLQPVMAIAMMAMMTRLARELV